MSIELCVLASGSAGNCSVVRTPGGVFLVDCGIGPRTFAARLKGTGISPGDVSAICLTHLDRDHFNLNWITTLIRQNIRVFCGADRVNDLLQLVGNEQFSRLVEPFNGKTFEPVAGVSTQATLLAHDREGSHGFLFDGFGTRLGYATDMGSVPRELIERFCGVDLLAIESNYDPKMQMESARPWFLKQRIMGGRGHLSNAQALAAVKAVFDRSQRKVGSLPRHVVLLHRSRQCNCPKLLRGLFMQDKRIAERLVLAEQFERTEWLGCGEGSSAGRQLAWAWG